MSVVFNFRDKLNNNVSVSSMSFSVDVKRKVKTDLLMDVFCLILLYLLLRLSSVSAVFNSNTSSNKHAKPPNILSIDVKRNKKRDI